MEIEITYVEDPASVSIIRIIGTVDSATVDELQRKVSEALTSGTRNLIFDLEKVPYMSSAGLRVLLNTFQRLRELYPDENNKDMYRHIADGSYHASHLKLLNPTPNVLEVLKIAGFDMLVTIEHDLKKALKFD